MRFVYSVCALALLCRPTASLPSELGRDTVQGPHIDEDAVTDTRMPRPEVLPLARRENETHSELIAREPTTLFVVAAMIGLFDSAVAKTTKIVKLMDKKERPGSTHVIQVGVDPPWERMYKGLKAELTSYTDPQGWTPAIRTYDDFGHEIGSNYDQFEKTWTASGNTGAVHVEHDGQNVYSIFEVRHDDYLYSPIALLDGAKAYDHQICIGWGANAMDSERGGNHYVFSGDMGAICGGFWHWSGLYTTSQREYQPKCFWIGQYTDHMPTGFQVRWPSFSKASIERLNDPIEYCNGVDFGIKWDNVPLKLNTVKHDPIQFLVNSTVDPAIYEELVNLTEVAGQNRPTGEEADAADAANNTAITNNYYNITMPSKSQGAGSAKRESPKTNSHGHGDILIMDHYISNSARELCECERSYGSDYANDHERLSCDMQVKKLYYYCDDVLMGRCFDPVKKLLMTKMPGQVVEEDGKKNGDKDGKKDVKRTVVMSAEREPYKRVVDWREGHQT